MARQDAHTSESVHVHSTSSLSLEWLVVDRDRDAERDAERRREEERDADRGREEERDTERDGERDIERQRPAREAGRARLRPLWEKSTASAAWAASAFCANTRACAHGRAWAQGARLSRRWSEEAECQKGRAGHCEAGDGARRTMV